MYLAISGTRELFIVRCALISGWISSSSKGNRFADEPNRAHGDVVFTPDSPNDRQEDVL